MFHVESPLILQCLQCLFHHLSFFLAAALAARDCFFLESGRPICHLAQKGQRYGRFLDPVTLQAFSAASSDSCWILLVHDRRLTLRLLATISPRSSIPFGNTLITFDVFHVRTIRRNQSLLRCLLSRSATRIHLEAERINLAPLGRGIQVPAVLPWERIDLALIVAVLQQTTASATYADIVVTIRLSLLVFLLHSSSRTITSLPSTSTIALFRSMPVTIILPTAYRSLASRSIPTLLNSCSVIINLSLNILPGVHRVQ